jgi:hypothetical protein
VVLKLRRFQLTGKAIICGLLSYAGLKEGQLMKLRIMQSSEKTNCISVVGNTSENAKFKLEHNTSDKLGYFPSVFIDRM